MSPPYQPDHDLRRRAGEIAEVSSSSRTSPLRPSPMMVRTPSMPRIPSRARGPRAPEASPKPHLAMLAMTACRHRDSLNSPVPLCASPSLSFSCPKASISQVRGKVQAKTQASGRRRRVERRITAKFLGVAQMPRVHPREPPMAVYKAEFRPPPSNRSSPSLTPRVPLVRKCRTSNLSRFCLCWHMMARIIAWPSDGSRQIHGSPPFFRQLAS